VRHAPESVCALFRNHCAPCSGFCTLREESESHAKPPGRKVLIQYFFGLSLLNINKRLIPRDSPKNKKLCDFATLRLCDFATLREESESHAKPPRRKVFLIFGQFFANSDEFAQ